jgi:hypothetical protein
MARTRSREIDAVDECVPGRRLACWSSEIEEEDWAWVRMDGVGSMTPKMRAGEVSPGCGRLASTAGVSQTVAVAQRTEERECVG